MNLLLNAIDASGTNGAVALSMSHSADQVEIRVEDSGPGLTAEQQDRLFEAFYTTKSNGTGLGLAVTKTLLEKMGASIEVSNRNGVNNGTPAALVFGFPCEPRRFHESADSDRRRRKSRPPGPVLVAERRGIRGPDRGRWSNRANDRTPAGARPDSAGYSAAGHRWFDGAGEASPRLLQCRRDRHDGVCDQQQCHQSDAERRFRLHHQAHQRRASRPPHTAGTWNTGPWSGRSALSRPRRQRHPPFLQLSDTAPPCRMFTR